MRAKPRGPCQLPPESVVSQSSHRMFQNQEGNVMYLKFLVGHGYPGQSQLQRQNGRYGNSREKTSRLLRKRNHKINFPLIVFTLLCVFLV